MEEGTKRYMQSERSGGGGGGRQRRGIPKKGDVVRVGLGIGKYGEHHRARIISPLTLRVAKTGRNHMNEEFTPLLPTGIGEKF